MRLQELHGELEGRIEPPVTQTEVVDAVGDVVLESPQGVEETVSEALSRQGSTSYRSVDDVVQAVHSNVRWEFVGRREYDDRAPNVAAPDDVSF